MGFSFSSPELIPFVPSFSHRPFLPPGGGESIPSPLRPPPCSNFFVGLGEVCLALPRSRLSLTRCTFWSLPLSPTVAWPYLLCSFFYTPGGVSHFLGGTPCAPPLCTALLASFLSRAITFFSLPAPLSPYRPCFFPSSCPRSSPPPS